MSTQQQVKSSSPQELTIVRHYKSDGLTPNNPILDADKLSAPIGDFGKNVRDIIFGITATEEVNNTFYGELLDQYYQIWVDLEISNDEEFGTYSYFADSVQYIAVEFTVKFSSKYHSDITFKHELTNAFNTDASISPAELCQSIKNDLNNIAWTLARAILE